MNIAPSFLNEFLMTCRVDFESEPEALMIRLFSTSAGEHTVVATVPAMKLAEVCRAMLSSKYPVLRRLVLKKSYLGSEAIRSIVNSEGNVMWDVRCELTGIHENGSENIRPYTASQ